MNPQSITHERYIATVADMALSRLPDQDRNRVAAKITYGAGQPGLRGVTYYGVWKNGEPKPIPLVEICAFGEEDKTQLAGTAIHELAHVLAGWKAGHGKDWRKACERLGLRTAKAAGNRYSLAQFAPDIRYRIAELPDPVDGKPSIGSTPAAPTTPKFSGWKPCPLGVGTRGGKSRGLGSGSRLAKCQCPKCGYTVRVTRKWIDVAVPTCPDSSCDGYQTEMQLV